MPSTLLDAAITADQAFRLVIRLASVGVVISNAEYLVCRTEFDQGGLLGFGITRLDRRWTTAGASGALLQFLLTRPVVAVLCLIRVVLAAAIALSVFDPLGNSIALSVVAVALMIDQLRTRYGHDGADQMSLLIFVPAALCSLIGTETAKTLFLCFVAFQSLLSYFVAGVAKLASTTWRTQPVLTALLSVDAYGHRAVFGFLSRHGRVARISTLTVVAWECLGPIAALATPRLTVAFVVTAIAFHLMNAFVMGLNTFLWAFSATYPAIYFLSQLIASAR